MLCIRSTIDHRLQYTRCSGSVITPADVRIVVDHLLVKVVGYALITSLLEQNNSMCFYPLYSLYF